MYQQLLSESGLSIDRLANFCAVADAGSIAATSKGDLVRQSLISRQIRELESFFGVELICREGRGIRLTEAGLELAAVCRENFKGLLDFKTRCKGAAWNAKIVASNSVAYWLVLPNLQKIRAGAPNVNFEIHHEQTVEMVQSLRQGIYDLAFVRLDALGMGLESARIGEFGDSLLIPKSLCKTRPMQVEKVLAQFPLALPIGGRRRAIVDDLANKAGVAMRVAVACSSYLQAAQALDSEACAAILPDLALESLDRKRFHRISLPGRYELGLAWSRRNTETRPALSSLIEMVVQTIGRR